MRQLRRLVTALTATLIVGMLSIVALLVIRLAPLGQRVDLPDRIVVPTGESAQAVTLGRDWVAVVTTDAAGQERIRVLDRQTGTARAMVEIAPAPPPNP